ncbi:MAG: YfbM family protein [Woeseiaceae bacterium]|nr:YfbM family protein [Woeseiaceae bacterium]
MGIVAEFISIADEHVERILADPPLVWLVVAPDFPEAYEQERKKLNKKNPFSLAERFRWNKPEPDPEPKPWPTLELGDGDLSTLDVDKSWNGIHYLLTKSATGGEWPHNFIMDGGAVVGDIDVGYGPARAFRAGEVREISDALEDFDKDRLRGNFDPDEMMALKVYPEIWVPDEPDHNYDYPASYFFEMRKFFKDAAVNGKGVLISFG